VKLSNPLQDRHVDNGFMYEMIRDQSGIFFFVTIQIFAFLFRLFCSRLLNSKFFLKKNTISRFLLANFPEAPTELYVSQGDRFERASSFRRYGQNYSEAMQQGNSMRGSEGCGYKKTGSTEGR
jgi:hypothetical protein